MTPSFLTLASQAFTFRAFGADFRRSSAAFSALWSLLSDCSQMRAENDDADDMTGMWPATTSSLAPSYSEMVTLII